MVISAKRGKMIEKPLVGPRGRRSEGRTTAAGVFDGVRGHRAPFVIPGVPLDRQPTDFRQRIELEMKIIPGDFAGMPSGSKGSTVASHNRFGYYLRNRVVPVNPNTALQVAVRAAFGQLSTRWSTVLTAAQREAWGLYGDNVPVINSQGTPVNLTGAMQYVRCNTPRVQAGLAIVDAAPVVFNLGDFTAPVPSTFTAGSQEFELAYTEGDDWVSETGAAMLVYSGRPQGAGRSFFKGPFRFADLIEGDATTPPTSPATISTPFTISASQLVWTRVIVTRADGRLSQALILGPTTVGA